MFIEHHSRRDYYRFPFGALPCGERVRIRVTVGSYSIPSRVTLLFDDDEIPMYFIAEIGNARLYECGVTVSDVPKLSWYAFRVEADGETKYYGNNAAFLGGKGEMYDEMPEKRFQITVFQRGYKTPDWMKQAVVYQIFPDRFYRSGDTPIHGIARNWGEEPYYRADQFGGEYLSNDLFGGNLAGVKEKLTYLKELGVTAIYFNPIFSSQSNHRYNTADYETVDSALGGNEAFDDFIKAADAAGIRVILDGVFSHTGADSRYFNRYGNFDDVGAYQSKDSPYYDWYNFYEFPDKYECWWGFDSLPNVNEVDPSYMEYMLGGKNAIVRRWLRRGISGWRLDVADELPDEFIHQLRLAVKEEKEDAMIIGEVWEDASNKISYGAQRGFLWGGELDSVMNYVLRDAVMDYLLNHDDAERFMKRLLSMKENYPREAFYSALNLISGHDIPRALTVLSGAPDFHSLSREAQAHHYMDEKTRQMALMRLRLATLLQMTLPGAPCIYYGDEAGMDGYADPFNRRCFPWGGEDKELTECVKSLVRLRHEHRSLVMGEFRHLMYTQNTVCFMRDIVGSKDIFGNIADDECMIIILNSDVENICNFELELGRFGVCEMREVFTNETIRLVDHRANMEIMPLQYKVFKCKRDDTWTRTEYAALV